jgi:tetratricopeptide (TPR) repeat protein
MMVRRLPATAPVTLARAVSCSLAGLAILVGPASVPRSAGAAGPPAAALVDHFPSERIEQLIEQLGDDNFYARQNAAQELERAGLAAFEKLRRATTHSNVEIATTAQYLLNSMRVVWSLPTDSLEVRRLLQGYNALDVSSRRARMQRLAEIDSGDARLALVRLSRYEGNETLSKDAALFLMEQTVAPSRDVSMQMLAEVVEEGLGGSNRVSSQWLRELPRNDADAGNLFETWQRFAADERRLLESNSEYTSRETVKRLYRWAAQWLTAHGHRPEALKFVSPALELVSEEYGAIDDDLIWLLQAGLPEALQQLHARRPELIDSNPRARYLLAESYLATGQPDQAEAIAEGAVEVPRSDNPILRPEMRRDSEVRQRKTIAEFLLDRGMFPWAEKELVRALEGGGLSVALEVLVRMTLAEHYWKNEQFTQGAAVWQNLLERSKVEPELADWLIHRPRDDHSSWMEFIQGDFHFQSGLALTQQQDHAAASESFFKALRHIRNNPDLLIALHQVLPDQGPQREMFARLFKDMVAEFRTDILEGEARLSGSVTRHEQKYARAQVASSLNQLAWLLACVGQRTREAVQLSERSLHLIPDEPVFMDTLARCYFADGDLERAVKLQKQAVKLKPFEVQMQRQLKEFEEALQASQRGE